MLPVTRKYYNARFEATRIIHRSQAQGDETFHRRVFTQDWATAVGTENPSNLITVSRGEFVFSGGPLQLQVRNRKPVFFNPVVQ